jgi:hypothetical protein
VGGRKGGAVQGGGEREKRHNPLPAKPAPCAFAGQHVRLRSRPGSLANSH